MKNAWKTILAALALSVSFSSCLAANGERHNDDYAHRHGGHRMSHRDGTNHDGHMRRDHEKRNDHEESANHDDHMRRDHNNRDVHGGSMNHGEHMGDNIHNAKIEGYSFSYHLIDVQERMKNFPDAKRENMQGDIPTHHLMVYIKDEHGRVVNGAKVGHILKSSDGERQKALCAEMGGGYGADLRLKAGRTYTVRSKVATGGKKVIHKFTHAVK